MVKQWTDCFKPIPLKLQQWYALQNGCHHVRLSSQVRQGPFDEFFSWLSLRTHNRQARHPRAQPPSTNNTSRAFSTFGSQSTRRGTSVAKAPSAGCSILNFPYHVFNTNIFFFIFTTLDVCNIGTYILKVLSLARGQMSSSPLFICTYLPCIL